jgi:hypothetical protein
MFSVLLSIAIHLASCLWIGISSMNDRNWLKSKVEALIGSNEKIGLEDDNYNQYVLSLYFVIQTMTTVGYGDVNPKNTFERFFIVILMLIGVVCFSFVSGAVSSIMMSIDDENSNQTEKINKLRSLQREHKIPSELVLIVMKNIGTVNDQTETSWLLEQISNKILKKKTCEIIYKEYDKVPFFCLLKDKFKYNFIRFITENATRKTFNSGGGEVVYNQGKKITSLYIFAQGGVKF